VFDKFTGTEALPAFLNQLYKICIGIAVVIAILQLVRAGIMYTMGDSGFAKVEEAKHLITTSLLGLLLVLAPYIVFSVINPKILNLNIDTSQIKLDSASAPTNSTGAPNNPAANLLPNSSLGCYDPVTKTTNAANCSNTSNSSGPTQLPFDSGTPPNSGNINTIQTTPGGNPTGPSSQPATFDCHTLGTC
jgi:hypothetical protein